LHAFKTTNNDEILNARENNVEIKTNKSLTRARMIPKWSLVMDILPNLQKK